MALLPRNILKSFFQAGDTPTALQFASFIDSTLIISDDRYLLGLKNYDPTLIYILGDAVIYNQVIYQATTTTTPGPFNINDWNKIAGSTPGSVNFKGTWDADTNDPDIAASSPGTGDYYIVSVAGNTPLNSPPDVISDWNVGDWAIFDGALWGKVDNTDAVTDATNVGTGIGIYKGKNNTILEFKSLTNNNGTLDIASNTDAVDVGVKFDNTVPPLPNTVWSATTIYSELNTKEPTITGSGNISDFWSGAKTFRNLADDVRAVVLTGLSLATNQVISATDTIIQALGYLQKQISDNKDALSNVQNTKVNLTATTNPTVSNDSSSGQGYSPGSSWINTVLKKEFVCVDATVGAAVWKETTIPASVFGNDYLVVESSAVISTTSATFVNYNYPPATPAGTFKLSTGSRDGTYRIQWSCVVSNDKKLGEFQFVDITDPVSPVVIGVALAFESTNSGERMPLMAVANIGLSGTNRDYIIQFRSAAGTNTETIYVGKIEIFRVS